MVDVVPARTPKRVAVFWYLIFADYIVDLVWGALHYGATIGRYGVMSIYGARILGFIAVASAWLIARRRIAWLRWPLAAVVLVRLLEFSPLSWRRLLLFYLPRTVLGLAALYCVFFGAAARWFAAAAAAPGKARLMDRISAGLCGGVLGLEAGIQLFGFLAVTILPLLPA